RITYSKSKEEHEVHLKLVLESLRKEKLYAKFSKYDSKEWNFGDEQLRLRWMIYLVVLADAAESVRDAIGFEYYLASSSGWTKSLVLWAEIGGSSLTGLELVLETTDKVVLIKEKLKAMGDRQKSYVDKRRRSLEFEVGDRGLLRSLKGFGLVAYRLRLLEELNSVHDTFYVSNLKKCLAVANLHVLLDEITVDKTLHFVEELVDIIDREIKKLKRGSPAGIHGLFSGWYCGLASRKVTLGVSMAWAKGVTTLTLCDIRKPIWYLDSGCSRHMTGVKNYLHKYMEQPRPKVVFGDDSTCTSEGSQLCDAKYIVQFNEKRGTIFNSNKEVVMITPRLKGKNRTLIEAARTMLSGFVFSKQYWTEAVATACYTQNKSTIVKKHLKTPYETFHWRIPNIDFLHVFGCPVYIHNHKDYLGKFNEKANDNQNGQTDQNDQTAQTDEILNDNASEHSNHNNNEQIIDNLPNTEDIQISEHLSSPNVEDTSVQDTISISNPPLPIPSVAEMLTRAMAKQLSVALAHECLFVDFLSEEEPKKVSEALKHPGWVDAMQDELNQFARNKVWTLVPTPYGKTIIG
ncbi:retrovirus-related pol polyprotein from transposon TNT 1-94, partial [Tanacetum coccineum]